MSFGGGGGTCMCLVNALMAMPSSLLSTLPIQPPALIYATIQVDVFLQDPWISEQPKTGHQNTVGLSLVHSHICSFILSKSHI
ncbi:hypothetical protein PVAP13_2NG502403 [Panicum virgatum]|uniref:Secreted protein n=1 Tax=Panicum virgatum TaxID=38727 RepID=A0A8T0VK49_PANVG|nr:hypothetical protein PVAP13_2NG502403 [Panicum virgatum]KAG2637151.1 hypothetical protein PVAP13_2NG502403 [Panicum virgatum]